MNTPPEETLDPVWYRKRYPDVDRSGLDARVHFARIGRWLGRRPHGTAPGEFTFPKVESAPVEAQALPLQDEHGSSLLVRPTPAFALEDRRTGTVHPGAALLTPHSPERASPLASPPDLGVHLHLYYPDLLDEMAGWLARIPFSFSLYVSIPEGENVARISDRLETSLPAARLEVRRLPNRGRDLGPMVTTFADALIRHEFIGHLHTKRSPHSRRKLDWRRQLLANLLGSPHAVSEVFRCFRSDPQLGLVFPIYHPSLRRQLSWRTNFPQCRQMASHLGLSIAPETLTLFPAGSMFWARSSALAPLFRAGFELTDFPEETGQLDGTPAHALERLLGELTRDQGFRLLQISSDRFPSDPAFDS